jgi:drug/metabolite transporter (DMT)-like permease
MASRTSGWHASPYFLLTLTAFIWSLNWIVGRAIVGHVSPIALTFIRWSIAVTVLMPFAFPLIRANWHVVRRDWKTIVWLAFWGTGLHNAFSYTGLQFTTATNGVILNSATPVLIVVLSWALYRETITRLQAAGIAVSLFGVAVIVSHGDLGALAALAINKGDVIVFVGVGFWAAYTVFLRHKPAELPGLALLACCGCVGLAFLAPIVAIEAVFFEGRVELTFATVAAMLYLGIFPSLVAYVCWNRAVAEVGPAVSGVFMHLMPPFAGVLAWVFLDERIYLYHLAGIGLILAGIALTTRGHRADPEPGPE